MAEAEVAHGHTEAIAARFEGTSQQPRQQKTEVDHKLEELEYKTKKHQQREEELRIETERRRSLVDKCKADARSALG